MKQIINNVTYFFNLQVSKLALQTLCEVMPFQEKGQGLSQQDSLFSNSSGAIESPFYFLTQALLIGGSIAFCCYILFEYYCHPNKCSF
jgi:hypothetical protein